MEILAGIGGGAFVLVSFVLGIRLLALAARTRERPELFMGLTLFMTGGIGYPLTALSRTPDLLSDEWRAICFAGYMITELVGISALAFFNYLVFRPDQRIARIGAWALAVTVAVSLVGQGFDGGYLEGASRAATPSVQVGMWAAAVALGWAGLESWRFHRMMKKRTELGLADPLVTDRLRLWALGSGFATLLTVISTGAMLAGVNFAVWAPGMLTVGVLGVTAAAFIRLAFLPPAAYKRRVLRRAATA